MRQGQSELYGESSLARGIRVLACFNTRDCELGSRELIERSGLPRATVFRLIQQLLKLGLLRHSASRNSYSLGLGLLVMANPVLSRLTARRLAGPMMQLAADALAGQAILAVGQGRQLVAVESMRGASSAVLPVDPGTPMSLHRTASGRAYLAALSAAEVETLFGPEADAVQGGAHVRARAEALGEIEAQGYCMVRNELMPEIWGVAAPVRIRADGETLVFGCSFASFQRDEARLAMAGERALGLARSLEAVLIREDVHAVEAATASWQRASKKVM
ncbi:MAG: IclR family transcriptional regulator [Sphingobium sp.]|nr:IclR family transcriptional regulator [Sphingobium sp.]